MGLFKPKPTTVVEGIVERFGVVKTAETYIGYVFTLQGDRRWRRVDNDMKGCAREMLALTRAGDRVSFVVGEKTPDRVLRDFRNLDL